jgi:hypothetical protein
MRASGLVQGFEPWALCRPMPDPVMLAAAGRAFLLAGLHVYYIFFSIYRERNI